jgi:predicted regulator of amino acid metabolism with ACT domain
MNISKSEKNKRAKEFGSMVVEEIEAMRSEELSITITAIAERMGVNRKKLYVPNIKKIIIDHCPELEMKKSGTPRSAPDDVSVLQEKLAKCKEENKRLRAANSTHIQENMALKEKYIALEHEYKLLLGKYYLLEKDKNRTF